MKLITWCSCVYYFTGSWSVRLFLITICTHHDFVYFRSSLELSYVFLLVRLLFSLIVLLNFDEIKLNIKAEWLLLLTCNQVTYSVYDYSSVVTFGGCKDDFLLVVSNTACDRRRADGSENLRFLMSKPNVRKFSQNLFAFCDQFIIILLWLCNFAA